MWTLWYSGLAGGRALRFRLNPLVTCIKFPSCPPEFLASSRDQNAYFGIVWLILLTSKNRSASLAQSSAFFISILQTKLRTSLDCSFEGWIVRTRIALPFIARFRLGFQPFSKGLLFQVHYIVLIFVASWRHKFRKIAVKNCEKSKNRWKSLCAPLRIDSWEIWRKFHHSSFGPRM